MTQKKKYSMFFPKTLLYITTLLLFPHLKAMHNLEQRLSLEEATGMTWGDIKKVLKKNTHYIEIKDDHGFTPLALAVSEEDKNRVEHLIANGAQVNPKDAFAFMPIADALFKNNLSMVELLLAHNASTKSDLIIGTNPSYPLRSLMDLTKKLDKEKRNKIDFLRKYWDTFDLATKTTLFQRLVNHAYRNLHTLAGLYSILESKNKLDELVTILAPLQDNAKKTLEKNVLTKTLYKNIIFNLLCFPRYREPELCKIWLNKLRIIHLIKYGWFDKNTRKEILNVLASYAPNEPKTTVILKSFCEHNFKTQLNKNFQDQIYTQQHSVIFSFQHN